MTFTYKDVIEKFGNMPKCYLTGRTIDYYAANSYQLDHKIPPAKGGNNSLLNLELACRDANQAKHDMTKDEFIALCKEVLEHNGYSVTQK